MSGPQRDPAHLEDMLKKIIATRHIIAHDYGEIRYETIWRIATVYLPELIAQLEPIVPARMPDPEPEDEV